MKKLSLVLIIGAGLALAAMLLIAGNTDNGEVSFLLSTAGNGLFIGLGLVGGGCAIGAALLAKRDP